MNAKTVFNNIGFISSGFLHLSPYEAYKTATNGTVISDVREKFLTGYKKFDVLHVISITDCLMATKYQELPQDIPIIFADSAVIRSHESIHFI